jgi:hypothetical protein
MHFLIDIEFTKILCQFKQKDLCKFIHDMQFQKNNYPLNFIFVNYNYFCTLFNKLQDHVAFE